MEHAPGILDALSSITNTSCPTLPGLCGPRAPIPCQPQAGTTGPGVTESGPGMLSLWKEIVLVSGWKPCVGGFRVFYFSIFPEERGAAVMPLGGSVLLLSQCPEPTLHDAHMQERPSGPLSRLPSPRCR